MNRQENRENEGKENKTMGRREKRKKKGMDVKESEERREKN